MEATTPITPSLFQKTLARRRDRHRLECDMAEAHATSGSARRLREMSRVRLAFMRFLRLRGPGARFQSVDFCKWLEAEGGGMPDGDTLDPRSIGGLMGPLVRGGLIRRSGYAPDGGDDARNRHSTVRAVWLIAHLDFASIGWGEEAAHGE